MGIKDRTIYKIEEEGITYKFLALEFKSLFSFYFLIPLQTEVPKDFNYVMNLYNIYILGRYDNFTYQLYKKIKEEVLDKETLNKIIDEVVPKWFKPLFQYDIKFGENSGHTYHDRYYYYELICPTTKKFLDQKRINHFRMNNICFLYDSLDRNKMDVFCTVLYFSRSSYGSRITDLICHLPIRIMDGLEYDPDEGEIEEYQETYDNHINSLGFEKVSEFDNHNSGNVVAIIKKNILNEKVQH